jgi:hypothetical protein
MPGRSPKRSRAPPDKTPGSARCAMRTRLRRRGAGQNFWVSGVRRESHGVSTVRVLRRDAAGSCPRCVLTANKLLLSPQPRPQNSGARRRSPAVAFVFYQL